MIKPPNAGSADPDLEAQAAIEAEFLMLVDRAAAAGWTRLQALTAIGDLADNNWYEGDEAAADDSTAAAMPETPVLSSLA